MDLRAGAGTKLGREYGEGARGVGKAIPAATGTGLGLDSAALCHDLFRMCAGEVDAAAHMCGFDAAHADAGRGHVVLFVDHVYTVTAHRS